MASFANPLCFSFIAMAFCLSSCSKDSDLLAEYIILSEDSYDIIAIDDFFRITPNSPVVLDVLANDNYEDNSTVEIIETSDPDGGTLLVNPDNTITYTPEPHEGEGEQGTKDTFTYTSEVTDKNNNAVQDQGTVTITHEYQRNNPISAELKAFPTALGFGRFATGGRGGRIIKVTNTNDSGKGSLRAALMASGKRIIVFSVGGRIKLESSINVTNGDFSLFGNSAPRDSGGITITGKSIVFRANNFIVRHVRFRLGDNGYKDSNGSIVCRGCAGGDDDTVRIGGAINWIFDHCEFLWGIDETFSINGTGRPVADGTVQNCLIAEGLSRSHHSEGAHGFGPLMMLNTERISFIRNYMARHSERHIRVREDNSFEMINNVINGFRYATVITGGSQFQIVNNHYEQAYGLDIRQSVLIKRTGSGSEREEAYISGNTKNTNRHVAMVGKFNRVDSPTIDSGYLPLTAQQAVDTVLAKAGTRYPHTDSHTKRILGDFGTPVGGLLDSQAQVGGFLTPKTGTKILDADDDGIRDSWEDLNGTNKNVDDSAKDTDGNGYTNIEEYLYQETNDN